MTNFWYNMSAINGNNGVVGLIRSTDSIFFFHLFGTFILITLFVIIFRATYMYNNNPKVSFLYTSFFLAMLSVFFKILQFTGDTTVYVFIALFMVSAGLMFLIPDY